MKTLFTFYCKSETIFIDEDTSFKLGNFKVEIKRSDNRELNIQLNLLSPGDFKGIPLEIEEALTFIRDYLEFTHGDFKIIRGIDLYTRIPENDEEKAILGNTPQGCVMRVTEVPQPVNLKVDLLNKIDLFYPALKLISHFNAGERSESIITKYLNYFKIIEDRFYSGRGKLKDVLKSQRELIFYLKNIINKKRDPNNPNTEVVYKIENPANTIDELVDLRDKCSHLRSKNNFGIAESDIRKFDDLEKYMGLVRLIAQKIIVNLLSSLNR